MRTVIDDLNTEQKSLVEEMVDIAVLSTDDTVIFLAVLNELLGNIEEDAWSRGYDVGKEDGLEEKRQRGY